MKDNPGTHHKPSVWRAVAAVFAALVLVAAGLGSATKWRSSSRADTGGQLTICGGTAVCAAKNQRIKSIRLLQTTGARPRWSPTGDRLVFDRKNADGYYDVYISDLAGTIIASLTERKPGIGQKNNGNAVFDPSGRYVVFVSENERHLFDHIPAMGDPGAGLFCDLWAADLRTGAFHRLTSYPVKQTLVDRLPTMAAVNPHFSRDGRRLIWTERYAEGGHHNWGMWRIKSAEFALANGVPALVDEYVLFTPANGNYVTSMGEADDDGAFIFAGNLDSQHEYGMDLYRWYPTTGRLVNLTSTPTIWEEDASLSPAGTITYMSNIDSRYALDFTKNWTKQPIEREYYLMNANGSGKERLTYLNLPGAPEHVGKRVLVAASDISPDGRYLAGTIGVDQAQGEERVAVHLGLVLIEFRPP